MLKKSLSLLLVFFSVCFSVYAEDSPKTVPAEYIHLKTAEGIESLDTGSLDAYLKTRLIQSPFFDLKPIQPDIMIHGILSGDSQSGSLYRLTVFVTDFEQNRELQAASVRLLSLSSFEFAIDQIVVQLEGREAVIKGQANMELDLGDLPSVRIKMPSMRKFDKRQKDMARLLESNLEEGKHLLSSGQYTEAVVFFENFIANFEQTLTDDYKDSLEEYLELAEKLLEESENMATILQATDMTHQAENLILAGAFEPALDLYILAEEILDNHGSSRQSEKVQDSIIDTIDQLESLCEQYIQALYDELEFNVSWYGFQQDKTGIENSFIQFYEYAQSSRFLSDFDGDYNDLVSDYSARFSPLNVPLF